MKTAIAAMSAFSRWVSSGCPGTLDKATAVQNYRQRATAKGLSFDEATACLDRASSEVRQIPNSGHIDVIAWADDYCDDLVDRRESLRASMNRAAENEDRLPPGSTFTPLDDETLRLKAVAAYGVAIVRDAMRYRALREEGAEPSLLQEDADLVGDALDRYVDDAIRAAHEFESSLAEELKASRPDDEPPAPARDFLFVG